MEKILTEEQMLLAEYLWEIGCEDWVPFEVIWKLWDEEAVLEMLQFCKENHPPSQAQILSATSEIYSKYKERIDAVPEATDD